MMIIFGGFRRFFSLSPRNKKNLLQKLKWPESIFMIIYFGKKERISLSFGCSSSLEIGVHIIAGYLFWAIFSHTRQCFCSYERKQEGKRFPAQSAILWVIKNVISILSTITEWDYELFLEIFLQITLNSNFIVFWFYSKRSPRMDDVVHS